MRCNVVTRNRRPKTTERVFFRIDLELEVTDAEALKDAALAHLRSEDNSFQDPREKAALEDRVQASATDALIELVDPWDAISPIPGIEASVATTGPYEADKIQPDLPRGLAPKHKEKSRAQIIDDILQQSESLRGIDFIDEGTDLVTDVPPHVADQLAAGERLHRALLKGLLWRTCIIVVDELFADIVTLRSEAPVTAEVIDSTWQLSRLPQRFAPRYGTLFAQEFLVAVADVGHKLTTGWEPPATIAEELALHLILDQVGSSAELFAIELADGWRADLEADLYQDTDSDYLFDDRYDGFENDPNFGPPGIAPMTFDAWFVPFNSDYLASPYATHDNTDDEN
jgi:hypothetical protein